MSTPTSPTTSDMNASQSEDNVINVETLPFIQMIKHAQESAPTNVLGQLLGRVNGDYVEITYAYGLPTSEGNLSLISASDFQDKMIKSLSQINVDNTVVGWYTSTFMNSVCSLQLVYTQYQYQLNVGKKAVALVIDSFDLSKGKLNVKAYRLTEQFMKLFKEEKINIEDLRNNVLTSDMILEEVPIYCSVNEVASAMLQQCGLTYNLNGMTSASVNPTTSLEKNMEQLIENVENVINERKEYASHVWQAHKQKQMQSSWIKRDEDSHLRSDMNDELLPEMDAEDPAYYQMEHNDRVNPLLNYCAMKDFCKRLNSVTTDDAKVLEKKL